MFDRRRTIIALLVALIAFAIIGCTVALHGRSTRGQRELSILGPEIQSIIVYDIDGLRGANATKPELSSETVAKFPPEVFRRAAATARHINQPAMWKGSSLAVIALRDGTERRAAFSYYGGFFKLHGTPGHFRVPGASDSEFATTYHRLIEKDFFPARRAKNQTKDV